MSVTLSRRAVSVCTARWPNVVLVDWHEFSKARTDLFARDGIHVNRDGARAYALLADPEAIPAYLESFG